MMKKNKEVKNTNWREKQLSLLSFLHSVSSRKTLSFPFFYCPKPISPRRPTFTSLDSQRNNPTLSLFFWFLLREKSQPPFHPGEPFFIGKWGPWSTVDGWSRKTATDSCDHWDMDVHGRTLPERGVEGVFCRSLGGIKSAGNLSTHGVRSKRGGQLKAMGLGMLQTAAVRRLVRCLPVGLR